MDEEELALQGKAIAAYNSSDEAAVRVLWATEMNLSTQGDGDMDPALLVMLDLVLGSFHSQLQTTEDQTARYIAALRNPYVHILAHPRGRKFNRRRGLNADWERVISVAAELDKALEVNAYPDRQDLQGELLVLARDANVRISIGTDAHSVWEMDYMEVGLANALRAGISKDRVLNFAPVEDVVEWARSHRTAAPV
jgi:DNA polymerase (family 10)